MGREVLDDCTQFQANSGGYSAVRRDLNEPSGSLTPTTDSWLLGAWLQESPKVKI